MPRTVLISTGESSGELYGGMLAGELKKRFGDIRLLGIGGERMREAGVDVFSGYSSALGLFEAITAYSELKNTLSLTIGKLEEERPDVVVLIDYPDFNFRVGKKARELGLKVLYYVSPQVWAWRQGRVNTMRMFVDKVAAILPFEVEFYRDAGLPCEFVGHPVMEEMNGMTLDMPEARRLLGLEQEKDYLALLPGSRPRELATLMPVLLGAVRLLKKQRPDLGYVLSVAPNIDQDEYRESLSAFEAEGVIISRDNVVHLYNAATAAIVASGTAAFQGVLNTCPLGVIYKLNPVTFTLFRMISSLKYVNLANIILDRAALPELLQGKAEPANIASVALDLIENDDVRSKMIKDFEKVRDMFEGRHPTAKVADMVAELAGWQ